MGLGYARTTQSATGRRAVGLWRVLPAGADRQGDTRPITFFEPGSLTGSNGQAADVGINDGHANERRLPRYGAGLNAWGRHRQAVFAGRNETNPNPTFRIGLTGTRRAPEEGPTGVERDQCANDRTACFVDDDSADLERRRGHHCEPIDNPAGAHAQQLGASKV